MVDYTRHKGIKRSIQFCRILLFYLFFISNGYLSFANVGQPGIWKAGGGISLLVMEDSLVSQWVSMESERVDVMLYSGFAVVHGRYVLTNESAEGVDFTMGYPISRVWENAVYPKDVDPFGYSFKVDSLASFKVWLNKNPIPSLVTDQFDNWITWRIHFNPNERKVLEVTYLTPTDQSKVTNMQGVNRSNGFMYIFETGTLWKGVISQAELFVHLTDGLTEDDIEAIRPCGLVQSSIEDGILYFKKEDWEPSAGENFYLLYNRRPNKYYSFGEAIEDKVFLFEKVKGVSTTSPNMKDLKLLVCKDILEVETKSPYQKIVFGLLGGALALLVGLAAMLIYITKKRRK